LSDQLISWCCIDRLNWHRFSGVGLPDQRRRDDGREFDYLRSAKKRSSLGQAAAASRGVFYELPVRRWQGTNGFTLRDACSLSSSTAQFIWTLVF
jgi:hypothetical protein